MCSLSRVSTSKNWPSQRFQATQAIIGLIEICVSLQLRKDQQKLQGKELTKQNSRVEKVREERVTKLKHKEAKEAAAAARFAAEEEVVANHLGQLIGDAEWLKSFLADVLRTQAEEYQVSPTTFSVHQYNLVACLCDMRAGQGGTVSADGLGPFPSPPVRI